MKRRTPSSLITSRVPPPARGAALPAEGESAASPGSAAKLRKMDRRFGRSQLILLFSPQDPNLARPGRKSKRLALAGSAGDAVHAPFGVGDLTNENGLEGVGKFEGVLVLREKRVVGGGIFAGNDGGFG